MLYARIQNGVVVEVRDVDDINRYSPNAQAQLTEVPDGVSVREGWTHDGNDFVSLPLQDMKDTKNAEIKDEGKDLIEIAVPYDDLLLAIRTYLPQNLQDKIDPILAAGLAAKAEVDAATTQADIEAVTPIWPE